MSSTDVNLSTFSALNDWSQRARIRQIVRLFDRPHVTYVVLAFVLLVAAWFRFTGLDWDEGRHLHPDERFLSTVTNDLKWPNNLDTYFDPAVSTLSPYSLPSMGLYVYGTLPVYLVKWIAIILGRSNYDEVTVIGRAASGLFDIGAIIFLFLVAQRLYGKKVGLLAAGLLSISVFNIQLSHFYAVDTFANLFVVATIFFVLRASTRGRWIDYALTGLMFGLGLATKVSVTSLAVPIIIGAALDLYRCSREDARNSIEHTLVRLATTIFISAVTFRVVQPIAFAGPSFWDWSLNPRWLHDINEQQKLVSGDADLPWVQQWTDRSPLFPLYNIIVWGLGIPLGLASLAGFAFAAIELVRHRKIEHLVVVIYVTVTFVYHAATFVKFMRYFLPIYPFLALMGAYLIVQLWRRTDRSTQPKGKSPATSAKVSRRVSPPIHSLLRWGMAVAVVGGTMTYALAFSTIYRQPNSRITASRWLYQNIPAGSTLANEHWDDWLPIGGLDGKTAYGDAGVFESVEMANYEDDTAAKLDKMVDNLTKADYLVISSNRLYDSIPRLPIRYPMTSQYYQLLFGGKLEFERVAEFTSFPTLFGVQIPDQIAEESFSVYDHPRVQIFKKTAAYDAGQVKQQLGHGVAWESVQHVTPRQASENVRVVRASPNKPIVNQPLPIQMPASALVPFTPTPTRTPTPTPTSAGTPSFLPFIIR